PRQAHAWCAVAIRAATVKLPARRFAHFRMSRPDQHGCRAAMSSRSGRVTCIDRPTWRWGIQTSFELEEVGQMPAITGEKNGRSALGEGGVGETRGGEDGNGAAPAEELMTTGRVTPALARPSRPDSVKR